MSETVTLTVVAFRHRTPGEGIGGFEWDTDPALARERIRAAGVYDDPSYETTERTLAVTVGWPFANASRQRFSDEGRERITAAIDAQIWEAWPREAEAESTLLERLRAERAEKWNALQLAGGRGVDLASAIDELDETIARVESGQPCCRECGSERIVAWYPEYARQGIELHREDDGTIGYDYTGEDYDHGDGAGPDDEYWCQDCEAHSHDLDYLVGAREREEVTTNDEGAMRELEALLDANEWSPDTAEEVAAIVRSTGRKVRPPLEAWEDDELRAELERLAKQYALYPAQLRDREVWPAHDRELAERIETELEGRNDDA